MKKLIAIPVALLIITFLACEELPDLNPNTDAGSDITVFEINEVIAGENFTPFYIPFDLDEDGDPEIEVSVNKLTVRGEFLFSGLNLGQLAIRNNTNSAYANIGDNYASGDALLTETYGVPYPLMTTTTDIPMGNKYIMFKLDFNGDHHYGWIEYSSTMFTQNYAIVGEMILNKVGIANEPGYVLRAGQID